MAKIHREKDTDLTLLHGKVVGIIGYGNQGHAQAQNLRDSGCQVIVAEDEGSQAWRNAEGAGFKVLTTAEVSKQADIVVMLAPDTLQRDIYYQSIEKGLSKGNMLMFAHGFNIHYGQIVPLPDIDVTMIAPKCTGYVMRQVYTEGIGAPALVAVHQDASGKAKDIALAYAKGIGCTRAGVMETTFAEETDTDLFGEQAVLFGGVSALVKAAFETLVEAGYQPEVAYFECFHELKHSADMMQQGGLNYMRSTLTEPAGYGDYTRGPRVIDAMVKEELRQILAEIQDGSFAKELILERQAGHPVYNALKRMEAKHPIELVGKEVRKMMPWLKK